MAKQQIVTFKVDEPLLKKLRTIPNRSEFIREAILSALDNACPLCRGTGVLSPHQKKHWEVFETNHSVEECDECHEPHLVCAGQPAKESR